MKLLIETDEIKPYSYGRSGKPTKVIAFIIGILVILFLLSIAIFSILTAVICTLNI